MTAVRLSPISEAHCLRAEDLGAFAIADVATCRAVGDAWIMSGASLALSVPSAIVPQERNIVFNVAHAAMADVNAASQEPFRFDPRLGQPTAAERL